MELRCYASECDRVFASAADATNHEISHHGGAQTCWDMGVLEQLQESAVGRVRTARKPWRCRCADPVRRWILHREYTTHDGLGAWSDSYFRAKEGAEAALLDRQGRRYAGTFSIREEPNPNYRPDCLGDIAVGDRYFEYLDESAAYESGIRYCARCAAIWIGAR